MNEQYSLPGLERLPTNAHEFKNMLEVADMNSGLLQLEVFYREAFPHLETIEKVSDVSMQRQGIDTIITVAGGKKYYFDEKIRTHDYGDILLEEWSVWYNYPRIHGREINQYEAVPKGCRNGLVPGWISGKKQTDYIAYIIKPSRKAYFLPFLLLQRAWLGNYCKWIKEYGRIPTSTQEEGHIKYYTTNIPIPTGVLYEVLYKEMNYRK